MRALHLLLCGLPLWCQVAAPSLGYIAEGTRLRPVFGIPASASVGPLLDTPEFSLVAAAPGNDFALIVRADSGEVAVYRSGRNLEVISAAGLSPDSITMSPSGSAALLWFADMRRFLVIRDLPTTPIAESIPLAESAAALAVSDDGQVIAGIWGSEIRVSGPQGQKIIPLDAPRALAFGHDSHELAVATPHGVFLVTNDTAKLLDLSPEVMALSFTAGNRKLTFATHSGQLTAIILSDKSTIQADCGCVPQGLLQTSGATFRFTGLRHQAFQLFDANTGQIFTVPLTSEQVIQEVVQ